MPEHDATILSYSHLREFPRADDALLMLRRLASLVKPLMRARRWKVNELAEFYPDQQNLLGLNVNRGEKILVRLRFPGDATLFLPLEQVADTILHELAHIVHGPHDATFHALWNQLRDEHMALTLKGYTGEGFLSEGRRLGGSGGRSSREHAASEARRLARAAAERRQQGGYGGYGVVYGGYRLGGYVPPPGTDMRSVTADAAAARGANPPRRHPLPTNTGGHCATAGYDEKTRRALEAQAARNGFHTAAEEEAANNAAIAQALWELVQEDERARLGGRYVAPTAERPEGSGGQSWLAGGGRSWPETIVMDNDVSGLPPTPPSPSSLPVAPSWTCRQCTLHNPGTFLCCDACGAQRPVVLPPEPPEPTSSARTRLRRPGGRKPPAEPPRPSTEEVAAAMGMPPGQRPTTIRTSTHTHTHHGHKNKKVHFTPSTKGSASSTGPAAPTTAPTWTCTFCGRVREREWWSCDLCGKIKEQGQ